MRRGEQKSQGREDSALRRHLSCEGPESLENQDQDQPVAETTQGPGTIRPIFEEGYLLLRTE